MPRGRPVKHADAQTTLRNAALMNGVSEETVNNAITPVMAQPQQLPQQQAPGGIDASFLAKLRMAAAQHVNDMDFLVSEDELPPSDSDYFSGSDLIGHVFYIVTVEFGLSAFDSRRKVPTYSIIMATRPDLGFRKLTLGSRYAYAQACKIPLESLPRLASCVRTGETQYDPIMLSSVSANWQKTALRFETPLEQWEAARAADLERKAQEAEAAKTYDEEGTQDFPF